MSDYTLKNLKRDVENMAPQFGLDEGLEARFARKELEFESAGLSLQKLSPNFRVPFGHKHEHQEEVYVLISGSARAKVGDEIVELEQWDALRVSPGTMRAFEAGPEGAEYLAFGAPMRGGNDAQMEPGWWGDD